MKEKILAQLKLKFAGVQNVLLGLIADKLSGTVTEESAIDQAIADLGKSPISITDLGKLLQAEGDKRATEAATTRETTLKEKFNFVEKEKTKGDPDQKKGEPDENPTLQAIADLKKEIADMKNEKVRGTLRNQAIEALKGKSVPENYYKKIIEAKEFAKEDEITAFVDEIANSYKAFEQDLVDQGFSRVPKPLGSINKEGVSESVTTFIEMKNGSENKNDLGGKKL